MSKTQKPTKSERAAAHAKMLETALSRPGVKESMNVFGRWSEADRKIGEYRRATDQSARMVITNSSKPVHF